MKRNGTIIYRSFYEAIKELPKENQAEVWEAIFEFSFNFREIKLNGISKTVFILIKPNLEANIRKYKNGTQAKQKQNGSKTEAKPEPTRSQPEANKDEGCKMKDEGSKDEGCKMKEKEEIKKRDTDDFDVFWKSYPKRVGKGAAHKTWQKLTAEDKQKIPAALTWQITSEQWTKDAGQFIPHPATYLNQRRWEDEKLNIKKQTYADIIRRDELAASQHSK